MLFYAGKFGAVFASIPSPIIAALYCLFFAYVGMSYQILWAFTICDLVQVQATHCSFITWTGSAGLSFLQFCNLNSFKTKFILGFSVFMGLSIPQYFNEYTAIKGYGPVHTGARWVIVYAFFSLLIRYLKFVPWGNSWYCIFWQFNDMINVPFSSEPFVAGFLAMFLDVTLHKKDTATRKDRGMHWWDRFRSFKTDTRSEEFYSLPFNLNKFFPSVWSSNI